MTEYAPGPGAPLDPHTEVGAYLIGALDDDAMTRFEQHLVDCEQCGRQLDELSGLVPLLGELRQSGGMPEPVREWPPGATSARPPAQPFHQPYPEPVARPPVQPAPQISTHRPSRRRPGRGRRLVLALAACGVLALCGSAVAVLVTQQDGSSPQAAAVQFTGGDPATGANATVGVTGKKWGTQIDLRLSGVNGPLTCSLVAVGRDGSRQTVATWSVPAAGYGTTAQPEPLTVQGAAGLSPADITGFDVVTSTGKHLVTVPTA
ncbi:anti-sigma factor family protein [Streptomyces sp. H39-S7]|uniref:anti-sigma factor family protein n=1 Tax=Streptomyces sp. H39-S7 TaxID=3004357 RepID=UPI0022AE6141|nr:zf-HC2 domain-containing protein [Streptomyces sp. H39-S7]MCZ4123177.1 zf-HC2 domain-containing protein [Streptomyces sp. H39-S7]